MQAMAQASEWYEELLMSEDKASTDTEAQTSDEAAQFETLQSELKKAQKQVALIRQAHTEAAAEFEKTKDRLRRNHETEVQRARLAVTSSLFGVADDLERSLEAAKSGGDIESLITGLSGVRDQFFKALGEVGLEKFNPLGMLFDPAKHDAIGMVPVSEAHRANTVVAVLKTGFKAGDHVLRAAMVQVGHYVAPPEEEPEAQPVATDPEESVN